MATMQIPLDPLADNATSMLSKPPRPYYPLDITVPGYLANETSVPILLSVFFGACTLLFTATHALTKRLQPTLTTTELLTTMWFALSGCIHIIFEGYYVLHFRDLGAHQTFLGQMWKEYAFSDSRYLTQNALVLCMEAITAAAWGPGCLLVAALVVQRHPLRFPLQALVSLGQLYGDVLYYATAAFEHVINDVTYSRPEALYFWFYFVFMNAIWIAIPGALIYQSVTRAAEAFATVQRSELSKKAN